MVLLLACQSPPDPVDDSVIAWSASRTLDADFTVPVGQTLVIDPGVTVTLGPDVAITVEGELQARGTPDAPIVFTGDPAARWRTITFADGSVDATFDGVDVYASGSILEDVTIEHAKRGMVLQAASPYLRAVTFRDNEIPGTVDIVGGAGLLVRDGSTARIRECVFEGNVSKQFAFGGGLYVHHADPIVQDCTFTGNESTYGGALATDLVASPIVGNRLEGNDTFSEGGGASLVSTVSAFVGNTVVGNHAREDGGGVHVCVDCDPHASPYLLDNVITGNTTDAAAGDAAAGVGAAFLGAFLDNTVTGNLADGVPADFAWFNPVADGWPAWVAAPSLAGNWWGTTDRTAVDATVWDGADDPSVGLLGVDPIRLEAPVSVPRVVIATRRQRYEDAGDAIPVFLTVYNPGPARTATLAVTKNGAPAGDIRYPGAARSGDRWTVEMPENSVWFGTIDETTYDGGPADVTWTATLSDGAVIGAPSVARYYGQTP